MDKLSRLMVLASTLLKLYQKFMIQSPSPAIIRTRLAYPFCARVIKMSLLINILSLWGIIDPMGSREHLSSLKDHFDTMFVTMHFCCKSRIFT
jgi:hypothetical protein